LGNVLLFTACVLIWGTTWYAITLQLGVVAPEVSLVYRFGLAALTLTVIARLRGRKVSLRRADHGFAMLQGLTMFGLNYVLVYYATGYISSGLVAVLFTTLTFMNLVNERLLFGLRIDWRVALAATLGLAGIATIFLPELASLRASSDRIIGLAIVLAGTYIASLGNMVAIRNTRSGIPVITMTVWGLVYGTGFLALFSLVRGAPFAFEATTAYVGSLLYLSFAGTAAAFLAYLELIRRIGSAPAAYTAVLIPLVALAVSTWLEGYHWTWTAAAGVAMVVVGVAMIVWSRARAQASTTSA
jgi:drug/metabolite transporter (DMT)-like permease